MEALIEEYGRGYKILREAIEGWIEGELRFKTAPNKWSIHQILIHMADSEMVSTHRLKKVLSEEEPLLMSIDQDAWANSLGVRSWTVNNICTCSNCFVPACCLFWPN
jgi:hypothetical protein